MGSPLFFGGPPLQVLRTVLGDTFAELRACGRGCRECQIMWLSSWSAPEIVTRAAHPIHSSHFDGFELDSVWLTRFSQDLACSGMGVRAQVHTHPQEAFHSKTDDTYPIVHTPGFLSLVIPNFGMGPPGFDRSYLAELQIDGSWVERSAFDVFTVTN